MDVPISRLQIHRWAAFVDVALQAIFLLLANNRNGQFAVYAAVGCFRIKLHAEIRGNPYLD